jgi:hypothetical protein
LASIAVFSWKLLGYLLPKRFYSEKLKNFADKITVALLAALVGIQGFVISGLPVIDPRFPALIVSAVLLALRVPFAVVVVVAALVAGTLRYLGF